MVRDQIRIVDKSFHNFLGKKTVNAESKRAKSISDLTRRGSYLKRK
jgi:hypothetical protein